VKVVKNKMAPPFKQAEYFIFFLQPGISREGEIVDLGVEKNIIEKSGARGTATAATGSVRGRENVKEFLKGNPP